MEDLACPKLGTDGFDELFMKMWVDLNVDIRASAGITLIVCSHLLLNQLVTEFHLSNRVLWAICRLGTSLMLGSAPAVI
jgi:hypothetical protein